ncbi:MAG: hypothetical protein K2Q03_03265, partial [Sphingobacteriaceae bacterium]|nr:hypothetical protein [Sphingobacteriaceae bacterium]
KGGASEASQSKIDLGYVSRTTANGGNKIISPDSDDATAIYTTQWTGHIKDPSKPNTQIATWTVRNATRFKLATKVSVNDLNKTDGTATVNYDAINLEKTAAEPTSPSITVSANQLVFFKTAQGKYGFILVSAATGDVPTTEATAGSLTFQAYYQK